MQQYHQPASPSLGARLRQRRWGELRVFQSVLAEAVGISPAQLCEIERGTAGTTPRTLQKIARVLELDFAELRAQAEREGQLTRTRPHPSPVDSADDFPTWRRLPQLPPRHRRTTSKRWLSTSEAAALLGCTIHTVSYLIRRGKLAPAIAQPKSKQGQRRWLVDARAVEQYEPPNDGRRWNPRRQSAPDGHLDAEEFARRAGLTKPTLYRRLAEWRLSTLKIGHRRWIPEAHLARFHDHALATES